MGSHRPADDASRRAAAVRRHTGCPAARRCDGRADAGPAGHGGGTHPGGARRRPLRGGRRRLARVSAGARGLVTDPRIQEMLAQRFDAGELPMNDTEEELLRYLSIAAALLPDAAERYKAVSQRFDAEGSSPELRAEALEAAADLAAVLGRAGRHHLLYVVLDERTD